MNDYYIWDIWDKNEFVCGGVADTYNEAEHNARWCLSCFTNNYSYTIEKVIGD